MKECYTFTIVAGNYSCNNKCPFCISKMTPAFFLPDKFDLIKFDKAIKIAEKYNANNVLITGKGEPTLFPHQIKEILTFLKNKSFARIELQTDGFTLLNNPRYKEYLESWRILGLDLVAISTYHYKLEKNMEIFGNDLVLPLKYMIEKYKSLDLNIRLSCLLLEGYLDCIYEVENMIKFAKKQDVMQLTFRNIGKPENITFLPNKYADAVDKYTPKGHFKNSFGEDLVEWFDQNAKLIDVLPHGARIYEYLKQNVCLTDCLTEDFGKEKIRQLIFYPNGWLCTSWEYPYGSRIL